MADIRINPDQVEGVGNQFSSKRAELDSLVSQAVNLMNNLQATFTGQRATAIFNEWASYQPRLKDAVSTMELTSDFLKRAANAFRSADSGK